MAMKRCPECGEKYSDTYKYCPFCEEEGALRDGEEIRRGGRRMAGGGRGPNLLTPTLVILIFIMAGLLVYLLWGDKIAAKLSGEEEPDAPSIEDVTPVTPDTPDESQDGQEEEPVEDPDSTMPEGQDTTDPADQPEESAGEYEEIMKLPDGLTLNKTDYTANSGEPPVQLRVSGGSGTYTWVSEDEGVASVDSTGKVTTISVGTVNVVVTDGSKKAVCIVRSKGASAVTSTTPATPTTTTPAASGSTGLKAGAAMVINGGNGVRVRSGPGTNSEVLATVPNGADINIVESAGDGWYKITFSGIGGVNTTGYMKGEFLSNK